MFSKELILFVAQSHCVHYTERDHQRCRREGRQRELDFCLPFYTCGILTSYTKLHGFVSRQLTFTCAFIYGSFQVYLQSLILLRIRFSISAAKKETFPLNEQERTEETEHVKVSALFKTSVQINITSANSFTEFVLFFLLFNERIINFAFWGTAVTVENAFKCFNASTKSTVGMCVVRFGGVVKPSKLQFDPYHTTKIRIGRAVEPLSK